MKTLDDINELSGKTIKSADIDGAGQAIIVCEDGTMLCLNSYCDECDGNATGISETVFSIQFRRDLHTPVRLGLVTQEEADTVQKQRDEIKVERERFQYEELRKKFEPKTA